MKQGRTLPELAGILESQLETKRDYVVKSAALRMTGEEGSPLRLRAGDFDWGVDDIAHSQISEFTKIPKPYYDRMRVSWPTLLVSNVNTWLREAPGKRLVRTLENNARAVLSEKYRPIDNYDLAEASLPAIQEAGAKIESCNITTRKMYIKVVFPKIEGEITVGDPVQLGMMISNSEVGCGSVQIRPLIYRLVCKNGMISEDYSMRRHHVGRLDHSESSTVSLFSPETRMADNKAFFLKVRDLVKGVLTREVFNSMTDKLKEAAGMKIKGDPVKAVEAVANSYQLTGEERDGVLRHLVEGGDLSKWGMINAITRTSQDVENYDRATELEAVGGKVVELPNNVWNSLPSIGG